MVTEKNLFNTWERKLLVKVNDFIINIWKGFLDKNKEPSITHKQTFWKQPGICFFSLMLFWGRSEISKFPLPKPNSDKAQFFWPVIHLAWLFSR